MLMNYWHLVTLIGISETCILVTENGQQESLQTPKISLLTICHYSLTINLEKALKILYVSVTVESDLFADESKYPGVSLYNILPSLEFFTSECDGRKK